MLLSSEFQFLCFPFFFLKKFEISLTCFSSCHSNLFFRTQYSKKASKLKRSNSQTMVHPFARSHVFDCFPFEKKVLCRSLLCASFVFAFTNFKPFCLKDFFSQIIRFCVDFVQTSLFSMDFFQ